MPDITIALLGSEVCVHPGSQDRCVVAVDDTRFTLGPRGDLIPCELVTTAVPEPSAVFTLEDFGRTRRLAWRGGGIAVKPQADVVFWEQHAALVTPRSLTLIDAGANRQARLTLELGGTPHNCLAHAGHLWVGGSDAVRIVSLRALERVLASPMRTCDLELAVTYPLRDASARVEARVAWVLESGLALVNIGTQQVRFHDDFGLATGMTVVMCDRLHGAQFAAMEVPGRGRVELVEVAAPRRISVGVVRGTSKDPAQTSAAITSDDPRMDSLLAALAADPEDAASRLVLADLFHELGADPGARRGKAALGPLAHFLEDVAWRSGLPWTARLVKRPPLDPGLLALAAEDRRLGVFSSLRAAGAPRAVYARLVASPRALGLRHVDVDHRDVVAALIDAGRTQLTQLSSVWLSRQPITRLLVDPTFDRVQVIEVVGMARNVDGLVAQLRRDEHGLFARRRRRLVVREHHGGDLALLGGLLAAFIGLPVDDLVVAGVRVRRDPEGRLTAHVTASSTLIEAWLDPLARALPQLAEIEVDAHAYLPVRRAFPTAIIR